MFSCPPPPANGKRWSTKVLAAVGAGGLAVGTLVGGGIAATVSHDSRDDWSRMHQPPAFGNQNDQGWSDSGSNRQAPRGSINPESGDSNSNSGNSDSNGSTN